MPVGAGVGGWVRHDPHGRGWAQARGSCLGRSTSVGCGTFLEGLCDVIVFMAGRLPSERFGHLTAAVRLAGWLAGGGARS